MITIKRDENLAALVQATWAEEPKIIQAIIDTIDPYILDDYLAGVTLGEFVDEVGYDVSDFIDKLHTQVSIPISVLDSGIGGLLVKLKFYYEGADNPCKNCGYQIVLMNDDLAVQGVLEGKCPLCHQTSLFDV